MRDHVRILAILSIVFGALGLVAAMTIFVIFGGMMGVITSEAAADPDALAALPVIGALGGILVLLIALLSAPSILAGVGLLKWQPWARILMIVLSALNLLSVPIGTALGIYGLWVMLHRDTEQLFKAQPPAGAAAL